MAFTITSFRTAIAAHNGISRPNLFEVLISGGGATDIPSDFMFQCKIATIPPSTLGVIEVPYFGRMVKVPGNRTFDNLSITVLNDEEMGIRADFEFWMGEFNSHQYKKEVLAHLSSLFSTHYAVLRAFL